MRAIIVNFRRGLYNTYNRQAVIRPIGKFEGALIGKKVIWRDKRSGGQIIGKIVATHGSYGYRAHFRKGLPGWVIGSEVELL